MSGDRGRPGDAREVRVRVDAGTAHQVFGVGAVDHHVARSDLRDHDLPHRAPVRRVALELDGQERDAFALAAPARERPPLHARRRRVFERAQIAAQGILAEHRIQRRDRLLPDQCYARVEQRERTDGDHQVREQPQRTRACTRARFAAAPWAGAGAAIRRAGGQQDLWHDIAVGCGPRCPRYPRAPRSLQAGTRPPAQAGPARRPWTLASQRRLGSSERARTGIRERSADRYLGALARTEQHGVRRWE